MELFIGMIQKQTPYCYETENKVGRKIDNYKLNFIEYFSFMNRIIVEDIENLI